MILPAFFSYSGYCPDKKGENWLAVGEGVGNLIAAENLSLSKIVVT